MSTTLQEMVREQIAAEGPDDNGPVSEEYIDDQLNHMTNVELLERISDALKQATTQFAVRPWL